MTHIDERQKKRLRELFAFVERKRLDQVEQSIDDNEAYLSFFANQRALYDMLQDELPQELHHALREYDDNGNNIVVSQERDFYRAGFQDAILLVKLSMDGRQMLDFIEGYMNAFGN